MDGRTRRAAGTAGLVLAFALAWTAGALAAPPPPAVVMPAPIAPEPSPDSATAAGWTLLPAVDRLEAGVAGEYAFALTGPGIAPDAVDVTVLRRDGAGFARLAAVAGPDGRWRAPLTLPAAGVYRVSVAFTPPGGPPLVLTADVSVPGEFRPVASAPSRVAVAGPYQVRLDGEPVAGVASAVYVTVSEGGRPVTDLEPVGNAFGRLVAVRTSDLAPTDLPADAVARTPADRAGPGIAFTATLPVPGPYALFLQFRRGGTTHVAEFRVDLR